MKVTDDEAAGMRAEMREQMAEIKRLQTEREYWVGKCMRLRAELAGCKVTEKDLGGIIRAQEDEIERLRAALKLIDDYYQTGGDLMSHVAHIAQEALSEKMTAAAIRARKDKP